MYSAAVNFMNNKTGNGMPKAAIGLTLPYTF